MVEGHVALFPTYCADDAPSTAPRRCAHAFAGEESIRLASIRRLLGQANDDSMEVARAFQTLELQETVNEEAAPKSRESC